MREYLKGVIFYKIVLVFYLFFSIACLAQTGDDVTQSTINENNPDSLFYTARELAFSGNYEASREICFQALDIYPDYHDFTILAARTLAWQAQFDSAQTLLKPVLDIEPSHKAALLAMADIEVWRELYTNALQYTDTGLYYYPEDSMLLSKRDEILQKMNQSKAYSPEAGLLGNDTSALGMGYYFDFFRSPYISRRHMFSVQYSRKVPYGPLLTRVNLGDHVISPENLFDNPSYQVEADYYPGMGADAYLYLNYGLATGEFFPAHRAGIEWFKSIGERMEGSIGSRWLYWDRPIVFFTGSLARYFDNYLFSFRPYFSPIGSNNAFSVVLELRRYLNKPSSFIFTSIGVGDSPDQPLSLAEEFGNFLSAHYRAGVQYRLEDWYLSTALGYQYEEYLPEQFRNRIQFNVSVGYVF